MSCRSIPRLLPAVPSRVSSAIANALISISRPFAEWYEVFPNAACVVSLIDRLLHNAEIITIEGESYRLKEARERTERRAHQRRGARLSLSTRPTPLAVSVLIPDGCTPEQARAVLELLHELSHALRAVHGDRIQEHLQQQQGSAHTSAPSGDPNGDDPVF